MNTKTIYTVITLVSLFFYGAASAHDPSKHTANKEKPNCAAMENMNSSETDMNDPIMQAMMQQCGKADMANHHNTQDETPVCTEEHAKLGHCTLEAEENETDENEDTDPESTDSDD